MSLIFLVPQWTMIFPERKKNDVPPVLKNIFDNNFFNYNCWNFRCCIRCVYHIPKVSRNEPIPILEQNFLCTCEVTTSITNVSCVITFIFLALHNWILQFALNALWRQIIWVKYKKKKKKRYTCESILSC